MNLLQFPPQIGKSKTGDMRSGGAREKNSFVLCFDGTAKKFEGNATDSNILKIYRLLDRTSPNQFSWYNSGLGTYVQDGSLEHTSSLAKMKSWYAKAKDEAVGTSLGEHVMAGYKFLMRYYYPEDDIYIFGFSRGAYTARFLAEMLDHIGLLSAGNEELQRFAWKCFSKWQARPGGESEEAKKRTRELYDYMKNFRETFSRPVHRVKFLGLFDTVNSVPRFESAWMQRAKFPYTARSSAQVIRHAVSINERRAKFRVDLVNGSRVHASDDSIQKIRRYQSDLPSYVEPKASEEQKSGSLFHRRKSQITSPAIVAAANAQHDEQPSAPMPSIPKPSHPEESRSPYRQSPDSSSEQDILEVWFSGNHGDIGGGWKKHPTEHWPLSHAPLVWMVQQAVNVGMKVDPQKMAALNCAEKIDDYGKRDEEHSKTFHEALTSSSVGGYVHDCLSFSGGPSRSGVITWKLMEYLPFRRMDLQPDGTWKPIRFPLPRGEVRDVPADAKVHSSVLRRMREDEKYRPGNLIGLGKGGRGHKHARADEGMGEWVCVMNEGHPVNEVFVSKAWAATQDGGREEVVKDKNKPQVDGMGYESCESVVKAQEGGTCI